MKRGRKSKKEKIKEIESFIKSIQSKPWDYPFINVNYIDKQINKFDKWGYFLGSQVLRKINQLKDNAIKSKQELKEIDKKLEGGIK